MTYSHVKASSKKVEEAEWRPRGWVPLKYPQSALNRTEDYFPLHGDVLLACLRELLILDGTLEASTLQVSKANSIFNIKNESVSVPRYQRHLDPLSWPRSAEQDETTIEKCRKRKQPAPQEGDPKTMKKIKRQDGKGCIIETEKINNQRSNIPSAEEISLAIIERGRMIGSSPTDGEEDQSTEITRQRPRKVSEADMLVSEQRDKASEVDLNHSLEISTVLDLQKRNQNGTFKRLTAVDSMIHTSITNEAILRDAAMVMTEQIVESFNDSSLRLFLGYKAPNIRRNRLIQMLSGFLFDTSHALFAWEQTEQDILSRDPETQSLDSVVQQCLFDDRALKKIGGFDPSSLVPNAISISRLRRRNISWANFATTVQGKRMLEHHTQQGSVISVGKLRRGQRLRQRHWLSSSLLMQDSDHDVPDGSRSRARSCSLGSSDDELARENTKENQHQLRILSDMPGTKAVSLVKKSTNVSWGVLLGKEGNACVVGRAKEQPAGNRGDDCLRCGDLILHGFNEAGQEAFSPLCSWSDENANAEDDWFRALVNLFKKSQELHLVVQRVH